MILVRVSSALVLYAGLAAVAPALAQSDPFQRTFVFYNTSDSTIYPVIESPQNIDKGRKVNCGSVPGPNGTTMNGMLRIIVNKDANTKGIPVGDSVTVLLPKTAPNCNDDEGNNKGAFYDASRIYMLYADYDSIQPMLNPNQQTVPYDLWAGYPSPCAGCWVGLASSDRTLPGSGYPYDVPGQLLEYTIISVDSKTGSAFPNANNSQGRSAIDFDVSYVDYTNTAYAMALGDGGATQFMGSTFGAGGNLPNAEFPVRIATFIQTANWSGFDAFTPLHWAVTPSTPNGCKPPFAPDGGPADTAKTRFSCLVNQTQVAPSAAILISDASTGGGSQFFKAETWGGYSTLCVAPNGENAQCAIELPNSGTCCPGVNGMQGCCDIKNFQVANTLSKWIANPQQPTNPALGTNTYSNKTLDDLVSRFTLWRDKAEDLCAAAGAGTVAAPVIDKVGFCKAYKATVNFVWNVFGPQCSQKANSLAHQRCTVSRIIGYDNSSGYNPTLCTYCVANPGSCPESCVQEQIANESVQALQRGLPWMPYGPPDTCSKCPGTIAGGCPVPCVFPASISPLAKVYQNDKFLHFWAPYDSVYNVNPYATFVHSPDGAAAPGAYSFSIDDFYGNFGGFASTLLIQAGGFSNLPNHEPFDPFKQYFAGFGPGWDHVRVCGRVSQLPESARATVGISPALAFWSNGSPIPECEVYAYLDAAETSYVKFLLKEVTYQVTDTYTGLPQQVKGLSGVAAPRGGVTPSDPYCMDPKNSTAPLSVREIACKANLTHGFLRVDFVGVSDTPCEGQPYEAKCGKPLISLNVPPPGPSALPVAGFTAHRRR
jgi:hypothetical protein